jgi:hypothetical protein
MTNPAPPTTKEIHMPSTDIDQKKIHARAIELLDGRGPRALTSEFIADAIEAALTGPAPGVLTPEPTRLIDLEGLPTDLDAVSVEQASNALHEALAAVVAARALLVDHETRARWLADLALTAAKREAGTLRRARRLGDQLQMMRDTKTDTPEAAARALGFATVDAALAAGAGSE